MSRKFVKILALLMTICVSAAMSSCTNGKSTDETAANVSSEESVESVGSDIEKSSRVKASDIISSSENSEDMLSVTESSDISVEDEISENTSESQSLPEETSVEYIQSSTDDISVEDSTNKESEEEPVSQTSVLLSEDDNYEEIYADYIQNAEKVGWYEDMDTLEYCIFDLDEDGTPELWYKYSGESAFELSYTEFASYDGDKVNKICSASRSGGSIGGGNVVLEYDKVNGEMLLGEIAVGGGFQGKYFAQDIYKYNAGKIEKVFSGSSLVYDNGESEYKINDVEVSKDEYDSAVEQYVYIKNDYMSDICNTDSGSNYEEKLKDLGLI